MSYTNRLKTKVDEGLAVFPILPVFDVPLQCDLHTQFEFVFEGDYYPKLTSFQADIQVAGQQLGCLRHFLSNIKPQKNQNCKSYFKVLPKNIRIFNP